MAGTRWAAQLAFAVGVLLVLAPAALWVGLLGPFYRRHHPLPSAAARRRVEARVVQALAGWKAEGWQQEAYEVPFPPLGRAVELSLLTTTAEEEDEEDRGARWTWDWPWLNAHLAPAIAHLQPLVHLHPVTARFVPSAPVLPPGLLSHTAVPSPFAIPTSALGTLSGHLDEAVLGPPAFTTAAESQPPLRLVVACPPPVAAGVSAGAVPSFVEDSSVAEGKRKGQGSSAAVVIEGWGGLLLLPPSTHDPRAGEREMLLSEAAHMEVVAFVVAALRQWVLPDPSSSKHAAAKAAASDDDGQTAAESLPLTSAEVRALMAAATRGRATEALRRLRVLQEEVVGRGRPPLTPVPRAVTRNFASALTSLERLADSILVHGKAPAAGHKNHTATSAHHLLDEDAAKQLQRLLHHASAALRAARAAERDPGLLAPPHLPFEHYAAILLPLFLPVLLPLLVGLGKERRRLREKGARVKKDA